MVYQLILLSCKITTKNRKILRKQIKKWIKKQKTYEKKHFSSVSFMRFLFGISIFRRIFLGCNRKRHYLCNRKNKVRGFKPELPTQTPKLPTGI